MTPPPNLEILLRVGVAFIAGGLLGMERETHGRAAGFRTNILVCVASSVTMVLSEMLFIGSATDSWRPDPARLGAGLLSGMGFLGAGTIMREESVIRGVTTAATLWFAAILGMTFGTGQFGLGGIGLGMALFALLYLPNIEKHLAIDCHCKLTVTLEASAMTDEELRGRIEGIGLKVKNCELDYDLAKKQKTLMCEVKLKRSDRFKMSQKVLSELAGRPGVLQIKWV